MTSCGGPDPRASDGNIDARGWFVELRYFFSDLTYPMDLAASAMREVGQNKNLFTHPIIRQSAPGAFRQARTERIRNTNGRPLSRTFGSQSRAVYQSHIYLKWPARTARGAASPLRS